LYGLSQRHEIGRVLCYIIKRRCS